MSNLSSLGTFRLGSAQLGATLGQFALFDTITITETLVVEDSMTLADAIAIAEALTLSIEPELTDAVSIAETVILLDAMALADSITFAEALVADFDMELDDTITLTELLEILDEVALADSITLAEAASFIAEGWAGVLGRIVLRMNVVDTDFCAAVEESGQSIEINGTPGRAFCFIKKVGRKYDHGVRIYPGDAVLYSCPSDTLLPAIGDTITFDGYDFTVIAQLNKHFDGNIIYIESGLQKIRSTPAIGQVQGLAASANYEGKTTLTWDDLNSEWLDHYEVWESLSALTTNSIGLIGVNIPQTETEITLTTAYSPGEYAAGQRITIVGSTENDGDYTIISYQDNGGGLGQITVADALDDTAPLGTVQNLLNYYIRDKTKANGLSVKNLTPNTIYYYLVRAVDKYGNTGAWSTEAQTPVDQGTPPTVEGVR